MGGAGRFPNLRDQAIRRARNLGPQGLREAYECLVHYERTFKQAKSTKKWASTCWSCGWRASGGQRCERADPALKSQLPGPSYFCATTFMPNGPYSVAATVTKI